jgi:purine-nucleoside phosphorylase
MYPLEPIEFFKNKYQNLKINPPVFHTVLGSGFGKALDNINLNNWVLIDEFLFQEVPGFFEATVPGHKGAFKIYENKKTKNTISFQVGRIHGYEGHTPKEVVRPVMSIRLSGTKNFILTNAAGSLDPKIKAGSVMIIKDHVNLTGQNPLTGPNLPLKNGTPIGPRFADLTNTYTKEWQEELKKHLKQTSLEVHEGVYLGLLGPSFETPAEIQLFSRWGLQAVGMSTVWEAIALKHSDAKILGLSLISNMGCGLSDEVLDHESILEVSAQTANKIVQGIFYFIESKESRL